MQAFCSCERISITPHSYKISSVLTELESMRMTYNYSVERVFAVVMPIEQSFARTMTKQHDTLFRRNMIKQMSHFFCETVATHHLSILSVIKGMEHRCSLVFGMNYQHSHFC